MGEEARTRGTKQHFLILSVPRGARTLPGPWMGKTEVVAKFVGDTAARRYRHPQQLDHFEFQLPAFAQQGVLSATKVSLGEEQNVSLVCL